MVDTNGIVIAYYMLRKCVIYDQSLLVLHRELSTVLPVSIYSPRGDKLNRLSTIAVAEGHSLQVFMHAVYERITPWQPSRYDMSARP